MEKHIVEIILLIMQIIALGCVSALCIYLIYVLIRVRTILNDIGRDFKSLSSKAIPVFENLEVITNKIKSVSESVSDQIDLVKQSIQSVKDVTANFIDFEKRVLDKIEEPITEIVSILSSFLRGVRTIIDRFRS